MVHSQELRWRNSKNVNSMERHIMRESKWRVNQVVIRVCAAKDLKINRPRRIDIVRKLIATSIFIIQINSMMDVFQFITKLKHGKKVILSNLS
jgi:hypothetical protein